MGLLRGCLTVFLVGALVSSGAAAKEAAYGGGAEVEAMVFIDAAKLEVEEKTYRDNGEVVTARVVRRVKPFSIDTAPVTNAEFAKFVDATSYATTAEIAGWSLVLDSLIEATGTMDGASPSGCVAVLCAATHTSSSPLAARPTPPPPYQPTPPPLLLLRARRRYDAGHWRAVAGAHWRLPEGEGSSIAERATHPVTHCSFTDAEKYCVWAKKRLPLEMEWRRAAAMGHVAGEDTFDRGGANFWEGKFPHGNTKADGFIGTSPVRSYRANDLRVHDMLGNVWEWVDSEGGGEEVEGLGKLEHLMGGSFADVHHEMNGTVITRQQFYSDSSSTTGFRCASSFIGLFGGGKGGGAGGRADEL